MNRIAPILLALGLACLLGPLGSESLVLDETGDVGTGTMVLLAIGFCATLLGAANLVRRYSEP